MPTRGGSAVGTNFGARGPLPATVRTQADLYNSGRGSAFAPGATVRNSAGVVVSGNASS